MNPVFHLAALRKRRLSIVLLMAVFLVVAHTSSLARVPEREGRLFFLWALFLPLFGGWALNSLIHEAWHRPAVLLLPSANRRYVRGYLVVMGFVATLCGTVLHLHAPDIGFMPAAVVAAAAFSFTLPFEPGWRWAGSRRLAWLVAALFVLLPDFEPDSAATRWLWTSGAIAMVIIHAAVAFSAPRRRARALIPYTSQFSAFFSPALDQARQRERGARRDLRTLSWPGASSPRSLPWWRKAWSHERSDQQLDLRDPLTAVMLVVILAIMAARFFADVANDAPAPVGNTSPKRSLEIGLAALLIASNFAAPRPGWLYPLSRRERLHVLFTAAVRQLLLGFAVTLGTMFLVGFAATQWQGLDFSWPAFSEVAAGITCFAAFGPLMLWARFQRHVAGTRLLVGLIGMLALIVASTISHAMPRALCPELVITSSIAALGVGLVFLHLALRRFHLRGDFVH